MKLVAIAGGLLLVTQVVLLGFQLNVVRKQHYQVKSQNAKAEKLFPLQRETARQALPLIRDARGVIKPLGKQTGQIARATDAVPDLVSEAIPALRGTRQLVAAVLGKNLIGTVERIAADANDTRRMTEQSLGIQQRALRIQEESLSIQRQTLAILRQSRGIQDETRVHARNLDNKTGGGLTAP